MRALILGLAVLVVGCSSSSSGDAADPAGAESDNASSATPTTTSGSRLRAKYVGDGVARQLVGFFDTQRQEDCKFREAERGVIRCLPKDLFVSKGPAGTYSDPACQVATAVVPTTGCAAPRYVLTQSYMTATCENPAYEIRTVLPASAPLYAFASAAECGPAAAGAAANVLKLGDKIAWTEFALGSVANVAGALTEKRVSSPDGASTTYGYHLDGLDADCRFRVMSDGSARCVPEAPAGPLLYGDESCSQPSVVSYYGTTGCGGTMVTPTLWIADGSKAGDAYSTNVSCGGIDAVFTLRPARADLSTGSIYESQTPSLGNENESCHSASGYLNATYLWSLGNEISATLPSAPRVSGGSGRLASALVLATADDGASVLVPGFHDTQLDIDCTFETASDGKLRCLPTAPEAQIFFTDATCSSAGTIAVLGSDCTNAGAKRYGRKTNATCPATTTVYALADTSRDYGQGSVLTGPARCAQVSGINTGYDATVADPAGFEEGQLVTE